MDIKRSEHEGHHSMVKRIGENIFSVVSMGEDYTHHLTGSRHGPITHYVGTDARGNTVTGMDWLNEGEGTVHWSRLVWFRDSPPHHSYGVVPKQDY